MWEFYPKYFDSHINQEEFLGYQWSEAKYSAIVKVFFSPEFVLSIPNEEPLLLTKFFVSQERQSRTFWQLPTPFPFLVSASSENPCAQKPTIQQLMDATISVVTIKANVTTHTKTVRYHCKKALKTFSAHQKEKSKRNLQKKRGKSISHLIF